MPCTPGLRPNMRKVVLGLGLVLYMYVPEVFETADNNVSHQLTHYGGNQRYAYIL